MKTGDGLTDQERAEVDRVVQWTRISPGQFIIPKRGGMRRSAKRWIKQAALEAGVGRMMAAFGPSRAAVLIYHKVERRPAGLFGAPTLDPIAFEAQLRYLTRHYEILPLSRLVEGLRIGRLPHRAVALTFDDGFRNNLILALPLLRRYRVPATVFLAAGLIGTRRWLWTFEIQEMALRFGAATVCRAAQDRVLAALADEELSPGQCLEALSWCLMWRPRAIREGLLERLRAAFPVEPDDENTFLTWDEARELRAGGVEIGSHTLSHPVLTELSGAELEHELAGSRQLLTEQLGVPPTLFAYPYGIFNPQVKAAVARHYQAAVSTVDGVNTAAEDPFELRRMAAFTVAELAFELERPREELDRPPVTRPAVAVAPRRSLEVVVEAGPSALRKLEPDWQALLRAEPAGGLFRSHAVGMAWWNHLGHGDPRLLVAREDGQVRALLPMVEVEEPGPLPRRTWQLFGAKSGFADDLGIVAAPEDAARLAPALADALVREAKVERIDLDDLDPADPLLPALLARLKPEGRLVLQGPACTCPFGTLRGDFASYLAARPAGLADQLARRRRWLQARPGFRYERVAPERLHPALDELVALHRARWGEESMSFEGDALAMHHELVERLSPQGAVALRMLHADGAPRAAVYGLRWGKSFAYLQAGYDPGWRARRPGVVLIGLILEECFQEGFRELDFLRGAEPYKFQWVDEIRTTLGLRFSGPGLWARMLLESQEGLRRAADLRRDLQGRVRQWRPLPVLDAPPPAPGAPRIEDAGGSPVE